MTENTDDGAAASRRLEAIAAFNRAWELIDSAYRTSDDDDEMLAGRVCVALPLGLDRRRRAACHRGLADRARGEPSWATPTWLLGGPGGALERATQNGWTDWRLASCYEGMARAQATAGNLAERDRLVRGSPEPSSKRLDDPDDRELIASQLASIPGCHTAGERSGRLSRGGSPAAISTGGKASDRLQKGRKSTLAGSPARP